MNRKTKRYIDMYHTTVSDYVWVYHKLQRQHKELAMLSAREHAFWSVNWNDHVRARAFYRQTLQRMLFIGATFAKNGE